MSDLHLSLVVLGAVVLLVGVFSRAIRQTAVSGPMLALAVGVAVGPYGAGWLGLAEWGDERVILQEVARLTLGVAVIAVALRVPKAWLLGQWRSPAIMASFGMVGMWVCSSALAHAILGWPLWVSLLVGAVITPTDPVLAGTIVTGDLAERNIPGRVRNTLSLESGANDGLAYPLVALPLIALAGASHGVLGDWLLHTWLWEVGVAVAFGAALGVAAGRALAWAQVRNTMNEGSFLAYVLALALAVLGGAKLLGSDGILAVFVCGLALNLSLAGFERAHQEERVQSVVHHFLILPSFVLFGTALPWDGWAHLGSAGLLLAAAVLLLRRLPTALGLSRWLPCSRTRADALFLGWFGPIGIAALYYAALAWGTTGLDRTWWACSLVIAASVLAHGATAAPWTRRYGERAAE